MVAVEDVVRESLEAPAKFPRGCVQGDGAIRPAVVAGATGACWITGNAGIGIRVADAVIERVRLRIQRGRIPRSAAAVDFRVAPQSFVFHGGELPDDAASGLIQGMDSASLTRWETAGGGEHQAAVREGLNVELAAVAGDVGSPEFFSRVDVVGHHQLAAPSWADFRGEDFAPARCHAVRAEHRASVGIACLPDAFACGEVYRVHHSCALLEVDDIADDYQRSGDVAVDVAAWHLIPPDFFQLLHIRCIDGAVGGGSG